MVPLSGASHVEEMPLRFVDLFQIGVVRRRSQFVPARDYLVVTAHDRDGSELQPFCEVHRADRDPARLRLDFLA
jgi:hypothetical protein